MIDHTLELGLVSALIVDDNLFGRRRLRRLADATGIEFFLKEAASL